MKGLTRSSKNYSSGNRPRKFFSQTKSLNILRVITSDGGLKYNPHWRDAKVA